MLRHIKLAGRKILLVAFVSAFPFSQSQAKLSLDHPRTEEPLTFLAPLPEDMAELLAVLTADAEAHDHPLD